MGETDSGSPFNSSWKLGALIGLYTTCCRALFYLDPVAKFIGKVEGFSWIYWILREPSVAFCFEYCVPLLPEGSTAQIPVFPHGMFCWIAFTGE